jgi:acetate kinase
LSGWWFDFTENSPRIKLDVNILVLNCGSSSVKFQLVEIAADADKNSRKLAVGMVDRLGADAVFKAKSGAQKSAEPVRIDARNHDDAVRAIIDRVRGDGQRIDAVGHRVVHGGALFIEPVAIDDDVLAKLEELNDLAPLHNPAAVAGIHAARKAFGAALPMAAVFDTAFHHTIPEIAAAYAIPADLAKKHRIRRYGFHGMAHEYSLLRYAALRGIAPAQANIVTLHLGNGCSACAIRAGRSMDTSMGFTPLEGLVMGSRSGDLDPALVSYLARKEKVGADEVERWLNHRSGLRGMSGLSNDMRELMAAYESNSRARLAVEVFCYRARKYLGAYLAVLGGADGVVFSGGIGENTPAVREKICGDMEWCGLVLDKEKNAAVIGTEAAISPASARVRIYVILSDEESIIARATASLFERKTN